MWAGVALAAYAGLAAYFRFRPLPAGIDGGAGSYRVPAECIGFFHDTTWYEDGVRQVVRQITDEVARVVRDSRRFAVMDVFLFNLQHSDRADDYVPTTRQIVDAFAARDRPGWLITDPINTSYGSWVSPPLRWMADAGVTICLTDIRRLRDNNLLYAPIWRIFLRWIRGPWLPRFKNPLEPNATATVSAVLEALNIRANHRKLVIADDGEGGYVTHITSRNFEDASSYFGNTALTIRSAAVARHFLEAEKAVARMSGVDIPVQIPPQHEDGDTEVTPLMGTRIGAAIIRDIDSARPGDRLTVLAQFLSHRGIIEALVRASNRGVAGTVVMDQNKVNFGNPKFGFPNQITGPELAARTRFELRWANIQREEYHNQFMLLEQDGCCVFHIGSANYNRRSLSNTVLEANVRIDAPAEAAVSRQVVGYARWMASMPRSLPYHAGRRQPSMLKYLVYRFLEATGTGTF